MMIKVNGEFLDFNGIVELEQRVKLFEEIDETLGDFSYAFTLQKTSNNMRILGNPKPDVKNKTIYREVNADLVDESGIVLRKGALRVERINKVIECSFFSGNYNWVSLLIGNISDLDFSEYDVELNETNIINSLANLEGIIFPFLDSGALLTRKSNTLKVEDFTGCFYVKTILTKIFAEYDIKITGDLVNDPVYKALLVATSNQDKEQITSRSSFAVKTIDEPIAGASRVEFEDDSTYPYFDGSQNNFSTASHRYNADVRMIVRVDITLKIDSVSRVNYYEIRKNGVTGGAFSQYITYNQPGTDIINAPGSIIMELEAGDYLDVFSPFLLPGDSVKAGSTIKVTPLFLYKVFGNSAVPNMTKRDFVNGILGMFNVLSDYNPYTKTITFNLFQDLKTKAPIDLSSYINVAETDYEEFIRGFSKRNILLYQEPDEDDLREYNVKEFIKYGQGEIVVDNDFLEDTGEILTSPFKSPISYLSPTFAASTEKLNFIELDEIVTTEFTSVTDSSGVAVFNINEDVFNDVDLVRVEESTIQDYNGDWVVSSFAPGSVRLQNCAYLGDATGKITLLRYARSDSDDSFLLISAAYANLTTFLEVSQFSKLTSIYVEENTYEVMAYAFFSMINIGVYLNVTFNQSLSFGPVNNPLFYQKTIIETYWAQVDNMLNDPVKLKCDGYIPISVYRQLTPLRPIRIKTLESNNLYYLNRISGYIDGAHTCEVDLIKLT